MVAGRTELASWSSVKTKAVPTFTSLHPTGTAYEYYAMSIGARSQSAKTYLEKHYEEFMDGAASFAVKAKQQLTSIALSSIS
jgi:20S proteasome alpha/beta subunit